MARVHADTGGYVAHEERAAFGPGDGHVDAAAITDEAEPAILVGADKGHEDDIGLVALGTVDCADLHLSEVWSRLPVLTREAPSEAGQVAFEHAVLLRIHADHQDLQVALDPEGRAVR